MHKFNLFFTFALLAVVFGVAAMEPAPDQFNAQLMAAAGIGNASEVERLLALRPDLNFMDVELQMALQTACVQGHEQTWRRLWKQLVQSKLPNGGTALMDMIGDYTGSIENKKAGIKSLIESGCDVSAVLREHGINDGWTALHFAAAADNEEICSLLLDAGARIDMRDARGSTPLIEAAKGHKLEYSSLLAKSLLMHFKQRNTILMTAMLCLNRLMNEGDDCAQLLYRQFMPLLGRYFAPYVPLEILLRIRDEDGCRACEYTPLTCLKPVEHDALLTRPIAPIEGSQEVLNSQLVLAAHDGKFEKVRRLLAGGASVNIQAMCHDNYGTALQYAASNGHEEVCRLLLANGADVNGGAGMTPLQIAVEIRSVALCRVLLEAGASVVQQVHQMFPNKSSLLHQAVMGYKHAQQGAELCQLLLDFGARMDLGNDEGDTPLICAAKRALQRFESSVICEMMVNHPSLATYSSRQKILRIKNNAGLTAYYYFPIECLYSNVADNSEESGSIMSWLWDCSVQ